MKQSDFDSNLVGNSFGWFGPTSASSQASAMDLNSLIGAMDYYSARQTNAQKEIQQDFFNQQKEFNANQANIEREWQEKMSNTAYQRMVQDLEKAGLNKLLAYNNNPSGFSSVGGASVGLPSSSRGSDIVSAMSSLATNNANKQNGIFGSLMQSIGAILGGLTGLFGSIGKK